MATSMESLSDQKACNDAFTALLSCFAALFIEVESPMEASSVCERGVLKQHVTRLEHMVTKYTLFITKTPTKETILPMTNELMNEVTAVTCLLRVLMLHAGPTLQQQVSDAASQLVTGVTGVIEEIQAWYKKQAEKGEEKETEESEGQKKNEDKKLKQFAKAGATFETLKNILKLPLSNTEAVGKGVLKCVSLVKDAKNEIDELREETEEDKAAVNDDFDEDDFCDDDPLTKEEYARAVPSKKLASLAQTLIKKSYSFILKLKSPDSDTENSEWLEEFLKSCQGVTKHLDSLGESLYPPQEEKAVAVAVSSMQDSLCALLDSYVANKNFAEVFPLTFPKPKGDKEAPSISRAGCLKWVDQVKVKAKSHSIPQAGASELTLATLN